MPFADIAPGPWNVEQEPSRWPFIVAVIALIAFIGWMFRRRNVIQIDMKPGRIHFSGRIDAVDQEQIRLYLEREFPGRAGIKISVAGSPGNNYKFRFSGALTTDEQQRIAQFLQELFR